jgi:hypothetical protein
MFCIGLNALADLEPMNCRKNVPTKQSIDIAQFIKTNLPAPARF